MPLNRLKEMGIAAATRADAIGCACSTQGGGMPDRADVDMDLARALRNSVLLPPGLDRSKALLELAAEALFAAFLEET